MTKMLFLIGLLVITLWLIFRKKKTENILDYDVEPNTINVFPDYSRDLPIEVKLGDKLNFIVKGYHDKEELNEVNLKIQTLNEKRQKLIEEAIGNNEVLKELKEIAGQT